MRTAMILILLVFNLSRFSVASAGTADNGKGAEKRADAEIIISTEGENTSLFYSDFFRVFDGYLAMLWSEGGKAMASPGRWEVSVAADHLATLDLPFVVISVYHEKVGSELYLLPMFETGERRVTSAAVNAALRTVAFILRSTEERKEKGKTL